MYFVDIKTLDELNVRYKKLSKVLHPDTGGSDEAFKQLKIEYDNRKTEIINPQQQYQKKGQKEPSQTQEPDLFSSILSNPQFSSALKNTIDSVANDLVSNLKTKLDSMANQNNHKK